MLTLTLVTLIALAFVIQRLRPLSEKLVPTENKDANNNLRPSSSMENDSNPSSSGLSSKNCYVTLVQHEDEQKPYVYQKNGKSTTVNKYTSNTVDDHHQTHTPSTNCDRFDMSSTNILCLSDEQHRTKSNRSIDSSSLHCS
jgi:hypothetical protein